MVVLLAGQVCSCARAITDVCEGLQSENPSDRVAAALKAARSDQRRALPLLVERLEDQAADVRFAAIGALRQMTGQTLGYRFYDPPRQRQEAVGRWRRWLASEKASGVRNKASGFRLEERLRASGFGRGIWAVCCSRSPKPEARRLS